ncbi:hypothetical protein AB0K18_43110 [Nonomuraea sp. NPDC049421]|uniref:hypothetical protein n=1 Tax=Nonomuraea sp. NPDC049421 TaxID=3155275 RepID=UPI00343191C1
MHHTPPQDTAHLPPESLLLRQWIERASLTVRRAASALSDLSERLMSTEHDFRIPESTLRNMLAGRPASLAPAWRLAAVGVVCNGTPEELEAAGRKDAAEELRTLRTAYREVLEVHGENTARLLISVSQDMPPRERDRLRRTAQDFLKMMSDLTPAERDLAMANLESFAELMKRHRTPTGD